MIKIYQWSKTPAQDRERIMCRAQADMEPIQSLVKEIIDDVKTRGDASLIDWTQKFDSPDFTIDRLKVSKVDIQEAYEKIDPNVLRQIREQIKISKAFHEAQADRIEKEWFIETVPGVLTGAKKVPIDAVGLYVPAGKAPLPTVAQILTIAAAAAGVPRKVVCFPPTAPNIEIIVAANEAGADEIYRVGGVQAIAALTFGTETISPVQKIAGPGNLYVQAAKLQVVGKVGIDMLSGPSEALIMADDNANPNYLAADILARCEHGPDSAGVMVTSSMMIAQKTLQALKRQAPMLSRQSYLKEALNGYSAIIVVDSLKEMIDFANDYSAEHLEIQTKAPKAVFQKIRNAGSVFIGDYAPVAVGDYASGTNHCLPTGVAPQFSSPVGVETFMKTIEFQQLTQSGLKALIPIVETISDVEGLDAHKRSVQMRFES